MSETQSAVEFNFDGIVGPTHNYAGLSFGNVASQTNGGSISSPKQAAQQGLKKMRALMDLGIPQAVIPPHQRPNFGLLRALGYTGDESQLLQKANQYDPLLLATCCSAASMWAANMATVSPSCDTYDRKLHITPANLTFNLHRAQEAEFSYKLLQKMFPDEKHFTVHPPIPPYRGLSDEGAANHNLLCKQYGTPGLEMFVYGKLAFGGNPQHPTHYPARQIRLASTSNMRNHQLNEGRCLVVQQSPKAIDAGVFHNDVICVTNRNVLFYHENSFLELESAKRVIKEFFADDCFFIEVNDNQLTLSEAVQCYIFNSQLVTLPDGSGNMALVVPMECKRSAKASALLDSIVAQDNPIKSVTYVECRESMRNGGGPACLRLRAILTDEEKKALHQGIILDDSLYTKLDTWIEKHYRETLAAEDLLDPLLPKEVNVALDELTKLLALGSIYPFQQT
jgi:succinylarginine dihydrolase